MKLGDCSKLPTLEESKRTLAEALVELSWAGGITPETFEMEYEGAKWQVEVRKTQTMDASIEGDFIEKLPE